MRFTPSGVKRPLFRTAGIESMTPVRPEYTTTGSDPTLLLYPALDLQGGSMPAFQRSVRMPKTFASRHGSNAAIRLPTIFAGISALFTPFIEFVHSF